MAFAPIAAKAAASTSDLPQQQQACNCVIFRLDDVQDYWLNKVQSAVMDHFISNNEKLTVGAIMNFVGNDSVVVNKVKEGLSSGNFELASHAWNHVDYTKLSAKDQHDTLEKANQKMESIWGTSAIVFIPPYNSYNDDTLAALQALNMKVISAEFDLEIPSVYNSDNPDSPDNKIFKAIPGSNIYDSHGIYHLPQAVGFYGYGETDNAIKTPIKTIMQDVDNTIANYGYAVVTLHPQDFAIKDSNQNPTDKVSQKELDDLASLLDDIHSRGYSTKTYEDVLNMSDASVPRHQDDTSPPDSEEEEGGGGRGGEGGLASTIGNVLSLHGL
jgi:peptidoglycan/xylan/chitin deacetylase (PgdA/CDA1 family)